MNTTPAKKHSRCRKNGLIDSPSKRKALHRRGLTAFRCWQHLTRCFSAFQSRKHSAFSMFRTLRQTFGAAVLALLLPDIAKADNFVVTSNSDTSDENDGELTLREAITLANNSAGPDTVGFASGLSGDVLILTQGELVISDELSIDASSLAAAPIIDADQNSRVIDFTAASGDLEITKLVLRNGKVTGQNAEGGGIRSSGGNITLTHSTLSGNSADGVDFARGGGIRSGYGAVTLNNSILSGNSVSGADAAGGGIDSAVSVTLTNSTLSGNSAIGVVEASGGGIRSSGAVTLTNSILRNNSVLATGYNGQAKGGGISLWSNSTITLTNSTLSGNSVSGHFADGGGIDSFLGDVILTNSTFSGNSVSGQDADGGGIRADEGAVTLTDSTLSGNSADSTYSARGGGISAGTGAVTLTNSTLNRNAANGGEYAYGGGVLVSPGSSSTGAITVINSTLSENAANGQYAYGGGIFASGSYVSATLTNSIIAGNTDSGTAPDFRAPSDPANYLEVSLCLIGNSTGARLAEAKVNLNNLIDTDPLLSPLADNGGETKTQLPFPGSPAINAGGGSPPLQDQRGFDRVGLPDIGAVEYQGSTDWNRIFASDHDGDGNPYGVEQALGTDPTVSDRDNPLNLIAPTFNPSGYPVLAFGIADDALPGTLWILERSTNLAGFEEIYRFDGTTQTIGPAFTLDVQTTGTGVIITDEDPPSGGAFYRFKTTLPDPG